MPSEGAVRVALIGAGRIGSFHAESVVRRLVDAELVAIADPAPGAAERLAGTLGVKRATTDVAAVLGDRRVDAVIIAAPARFHADLVEGAARAGKGIFVEKPMALTLADANRAIAATEKAHVVLQVGFNRRWDRAFAEAKAAIAAGKVGVPHLLRSLTRDPGPFLGDPATIPPWTIFYETLIHDFDALLWLNEGARPVEVFTVADALVRPEGKKDGFLDTAVVTISFDNGSIAVAEANFSALYGYDIRAEVFGSAGMVTVGDVRRSSMTLFDKDGVSNATWRKDTDHFLAAYTAELAQFASAVRSRDRIHPNGDDARRALVLALAAIESVRAHAPVTVSDGATA